MEKVLKTLGRMLKILLFIIVVLCLITAGINGYIYFRGAPALVEEPAPGKEADCILVLGAGLKADGTPNYMLKDRLDRGIELYWSGAAPKLLLSGDHGKKYYDEVNAMRRYVLSQGVPVQDIFMDHAGFSTYESIYRAQAIFEVKDMLIVSQRYHLYRALYIAKVLDMEAYGIAARPVRYPGQSLRDLREIAARVKDFAQVHLKIKPTYLGQKIPITGDGNVTND